MRELAFAVCDGEFFMALILLWIMKRANIGGFCAYGKAHFIASGITCGICRCLQNPITDDSHGKHGYKRPFQIMQLGIGGGGG